MSFTSARRDLWLVVCAKSVSLLGDEVAALALTLRLQAHGAGTAAVAALLIAALLPVLVLAPAVGRLVDSRDSRALLIGSSVAQAVLCAVLAMQTSTAAILALVCALGIGQAVNGATWQALLPGIVGTDGLPRALGYLQAAGTVAFVASPALAGVLFGTYGARIPLLLDAASFLAITLAALLVATRHGRVGGTRAERQHGGLRLLRADPLLRPLLILLAVFATLCCVVNVVDVFLVRGTLHAGAAWYGAAGASFAVGMLVSSLAAGRLRGQLVLARGFVASAVLIAVALAAIATVPNVYVLLPLGLLVGVGNGVLNVTVGALVLGRAAESARGRIGAALNAVTSGAAIGAYLVGGMLGVVLTPREIYALGGVLGLLAPALFARRLLRAARATATRLPDARPRPADSLA